MDPLRPLLESLVHALEGEEELREVLQELQAEEAVGEVEGEGSGARGDLEREPPRHEVGLEEPAQHARIEESHEAVGSLEEVEGVAGGRGVDHDQVVGAGAVDLVEPLHGDVLVALHEAAGDVLVQGVLEDASGGDAVGRVAADQLVPRLAGVEHGRPQLAPRLHPRLLDHVVGHPRLGVAQRFQPQGVGQPAGGIDGEHQHPAAERQAGHGGGGSGRGGLADAPRAAADHDLAGGQQRLDRTGPAVPAGAVSPGRAQYPSSAPRASAVWAVVRSPWPRVNR